MEFLSQTLHVVHENYKKTESHGRLVSRFLSISYGKTLPRQGAAAHFAILAMLILTLVFACNNYGLVEKLENPGGTTGGKQF